MTIQTDIVAFVGRPPAKASGPALHRWLWAPMLVVAVLVGAYEAQIALESPGTVIRHDLVRTGSNIAALPWSTPRADVRRVALRQLPGYSATADATGFPAYVTVTLHDLDHDACRDAYRMAGRIEGLTVIAIEGRGDVACGDHNALTWRIMP